MNREDLRIVDWWLDEKTSERTFMNRAERIAMQNMTFQNIEAIYDMEIQLNERIDQLRRKMNAQMINLQVYSIRVQCTASNANIKWVQESGRVSREQFDRVKSRGVHLSIDKQGKVSLL